MGIIASGLKKVGEALGWVVDRFLAALGWVKDKIGAFLSFLFSKFRTAGKENPGKRDAPGDADTEKLLRSLLDPLLEGMHAAPGDAGFSSGLRKVCEALGWVVDNFLAALGWVVDKIGAFLSFHFSNFRTAGKENPGKCEAAGDLFLRFPFNSAGSSSGKEAGKENPGKRDAPGDADIAEQMLRSLLDPLLAITCGAAGDAEQLLRYLLNLLFAVVSSQFDIEAFLIKY